jgi:hypothetical protein
MKEIPFAFDSFLALYRGSGSQAIGIHWVDLGFSDLGGRRPHYHRASPGRLPMLKVSILGAKATRDVCLEFWTD